MKQRYTISISLLKPSIGPHVLLIQVPVHGWKWGIVYVILKKSFQYFSYAFTHFPSSMWKVVYFYISSFCVTFGALTIFDEAYVKSRHPDNLKGVSNFVRGGTW